MRYLKYVYLTIILFQFCLTEGKSQPNQNFRLWGVASPSFNGYGNGNIFSIKPDGSDLVRSKIFVGSVDGANPTGSLIHHEGFLYGIANGGGDHGFGAIIKMKADGSEYKTLFSFDIDNGYLPFGKLTLGSDAKLYGMTSSGGANQAGVIFRIETDGTGFAKLYDFNMTTSDGAQPHGSLLLGTDGLLYGTTTANNETQGTIFRIQPDGTGFLKVFDFDFWESGSPVQTSLIEGTDGYLYTMTNLGGLNNFGTVFKIKKDGSDYTKLKDLGNGFASRGNPAEGALIQAADGLLYGVNPSTDSNPDGSVFKIETNGDNYTELVQFDGTNGSFPDGSLTQTSDGTLYGITQSGGIHNLGTVYKLNPDGSDFLKLYDFDLIHSGNPLALRDTKLTEVNGVLFGTTALGSTSGNGSLFKLNAEGEFTLLKDFPQDLTQPVGHMLLASDGMMYGITNAGGPTGFGGVYRIKSNGTGYESIHNFEVPGIVDQSQPNAWENGLIEDADGFLYGMTYRGGSNNKGTIFKLKKDGTSFTKLFDFDDANGSLPEGTLTLASNGFLYGTASAGGLSGNNGTVFKINKDGSDFQKIADFTLASSNPEGTLVQCTDNKLYGNFSYGGSKGYGGIFRLGLAGEELENIINFDNTYSGIGGGTGMRFFQGSNETLYSMNSGGGSFGSGVLYKVDLDGSNFTKLHEFAASEGNGHRGGIVLAPNGFLYVSKSLGGATGLGGLFKIKSDGTEFSKLFDFTLAGGSAVLSALTVVMQDLTTQTISFEPIEPKAFDQFAFDLTASSTSGLPISYSSDNTNVATIEGNKVTIVGVGSATITASQAGNENYFSANTVQQTLTVTKGNQTITFSSLQDKSVSDTPFDLSATSSSGLPITFISENSSVATISGSTITLIGAGTTTITASQNGDDHYLPAATVTETLTVKLVTGLDEGSNSLVKIYPNPAQEQLFLSLPGEDENKNITIYNTEGKIMYQTTSSDKEISLPVSSYNFGVYYIKIISSKNQLVTRFLKN